MPGTDLVTGATGFSGAYVVRDLLAAGRRVIATDLQRVLDDAAHREVLSAVGLDLQHPKLQIVPSDLLDPASLTGLFEAPVDRVFHTASLYDYSATVDLLRRVNVDGTKNLLAAIDGAGGVKRFVHWSTCGVFGKPYTAADRPNTNLPFAEDSPSPRNSPDGASGPADTELVNEYSITKWEQEQLVWRWSRNGGSPVTVVRPAPMYGPGSSYGHGGIILAIAQGLVPVVPRDAKNYITSSVHVEDMARFACHVAGRKESAGEDYNVVDNSIISYFEFLKYIGLLTGRKLPEVWGINLKLAMPVLEAAAKSWTFLERRFGVPRPRILEVQSASYMSSSYWLDNRKSLATGFEYKYSDVREGLKDTIAWFRRMGWLMDRGRLLTSQGVGPKLLD